MSGIYSFLFYHFFFFSFLSLNLHLVEINKVKSITVNKVKVKQNFISFELNKFLCTIIIITSY